MLRKALYLSVFMALLIAVSTLGFAQGQGKGKGKGKGGPPQPPEVTMLKEGVYWLNGLGGNTTVQVTPAGLIVSDTKNLGEENYNLLMQSIRTISQAPVEYAIVTHVHQDHSGNTGSFIANGAEVIANEGEKANLATYQSNAGTPAEPSITYSDEYNLDLGGVEVDIYHFGPAHTGGDSIVHFKSAGVVAGGDVVVGTAPNTDFPQGGSAVSWAKVMDQILELDFDILVPGHGNPMTRAEVEEYASKWNTFVSRAVDAVRRGVSKEELLANIQVDDIGWNTGSYAQPARLDPFYAELQAAAGN